MDGWTKVSSGWTRGESSSKRMSDHRGRTWGRTKAEWNCADTWVSLRSEHYLWTICRLSRVEMMDRARVGGVSAKKLQARSETREIKRREEQNEGGVKNDVLQVSNRLTQQQCQSNKISSDLSDHVSACCMEYAISLKQHLGFNTTDLCTVICCLIW